MEGRVDENNRSLLPNPFVSTVLIHLNNPPPPPPWTAHRPSAPCFCTIYQALPPHKQPTALLKPILVPQTVKQRYTAAAVDPLTNMQLSFNSVPAFILFISVAIGDKSLFWMACFVCLCKHILILHQRVNVCVLQIAKYCPPFCVFCFHAFSPLCFVLLCFGYCTV